MVLRDLPAKTKYESANRATSAIEGEHEGAMPRSNTKKMRGQVCDANGSAGLSLWLTKARFRPVATPGRDESAPDLLSPMNIGCSQTALRVFFVPSRLRVRRIVARGARIAVGYLACRCLPCVQTTPNRRGRITTLPIGPPPLTCPPAASGLPLTLSTARLSTPGCPTARRRVRCSVCSRRR